MFSAVLALAAVGIAWILVQKQADDAAKRDEDQLAPVRVRVQRDQIERRRAH
jgi:hypothetical protein